MSPKHPSQGALRAPTLIALVIAALGAGVGLWLVLEPMAESTGAHAPPPSAVTVSLDPPASAPDGAMIELAALRVPAAIEPAEAPPPPPDDPGIEIAAGDAWLSYARPFDAPPGTPRIAIVVTGLGTSAAATGAAIRLPGGVTLSFTSQGRNLQDWVDKARAAGHEVMIDLPMEPLDYPALDPGPQTLLTSLTSAENVALLKWHLGRAIGFVGVMHSMGSRFTASPDALRPILSALKVRGLIFLDGRTTSHSVAARLASSIGLPRAINDRFLDDHASRDAIDRRLAEIEAIARDTGYAVAIGRAYPVTFERLANWLPTLAERGFVLAPISALINRQALP